MKTRRERAKRAARLLLLPGRFAPGSVYRRKCFSILARIRNFVAANGRERTLYRPLSFSLSPFLSRSLARSLSLSLRLFPPPLLFAKEST